LYTDSTNSWAFLQAIKSRKLEAVGREAFIEVESQNTEYRIQKKGVKKKEATEAQRHGGEWSGEWGMGKKGSQNSEFRSQETEEKDVAALTLRNGLRQ
jgi:hypothetical protein